MIGDERMKIHWCMACNSGSSFLKTLIFAEKQLQLQTWHYYYTTTVVVDPASEQSGTRKASIRIFEVLGGS